MVRGSGGRYVGNGRLVLLVALDLLLVGVCIALIATASLEGFWWKRVAADGDGGSTVPIPPPERPTPRISNGTSSETPTPSDGFIDLTLADIGLRILSEASPLAGQRVAFLFPPTPAFGIDWRAALPPGEGGVLIIPLSTGKIPGQLRIELGPLHANDAEATAAVLGIELLVGPVEVERIGSQQGIVRISAKLGRLPTGIVIDIGGIPSGSGMLAAINEAAGMIEMGVVSIAHVAKIDTNLADEITSARIEMAVDKGWAEAWSRDRVLVARIGQDGKGSILETALLPEDASGLARFRGGSPEGFSTFALVVLGAVTPRESGSGPSSALWFGVGLGVVGLLGLATGAFVLMSSQRRRRNA